MCRSGQHTYLSRSSLLLVPSSIVLYRGRLSNSLGRVRQILGCESTFIVAWLAEDMLSCQYVHRGKCLKHKHQRTSISMLIVLKCSRPLEPLGVNVSQRSASTFAVEDAVGSSHVSPKPWTSRLANFSVHAYQCLDRVRCHRRSRCSRQSPRRNCSCVLSPMAGSDGVAPKM